MHEFAKREQNRRGQVCFGLGSAVSALFRWGGIACSSPESLRAPGEFPRAQVLRMFPSDSARARVHGGFQMLRSCFETPAP